MNLVSQVAIICLGPLQFGLHMSELNAPLPYMGCTASTNDCIAGIGDGASASSSFAIGGLVGSLVAGSLAEIHGRRRVMQGVSLLFFLGSLVAATSAANGQLVVGRLISGLSAGAAIVVAPMFISELSPPEQRGTFGACVQISVNSGILLTQVLGSVWARQHWRRIVWAGVVAALVQFAGLLGLPESPKWGGAQHGAQYASLSEPELGPGAPRATFLDFVTLRRYRRSFLLAAAIMCIQQFSGINAIIFYGVSILKKSIPQNSELINVALSLTNLGVTAASARFIDSVGRRPLLRASLAGMAVGTTLLALGLGQNLPLLSAAAALVVIIAFATGLGPIPFLLISEITAPEALGVAQSVATTFNWLATFVIGAFFPLAERLLGSWVWVFFGVVCVFGVWVVSWVE